MANDGGGNPTAGTAPPFLDRLFSTRFAPFGFPRIEHLDSQEVFTYWRANPREFTLDENGPYRSHLANSKLARESVSGAYLRGDVALLDRRLLLVAGARAEQTDKEAAGPPTDPTRNAQHYAQGHP